MPEPMVPSDDNQSARSTEQEVASGRTAGTPVKMIVSVAVVLGVLFAFVLTLVALAYTLA